MSCVHFVAFRGEEYWSAVRVWGKPDLIHIGWDRRAQREIEDGDIVVFAKGTEHDPFPRNRRTGLEFNYPDILETNRS